MGQTGASRIGTLVSAGGDVLHGRSGRQALRAVANDKLGDNAYARVRGEKRSLPGWVFPSVLATFTVVRVLCIGVMIAAAAGWLLDPASWATGVPIAAAHKTPFHGHPNVYGWRYGFQGLVYLHVATGTGLLLACLVPLFAKKGGRTHRLFGRAFVGLWVVHLFDGLINSAQILLTRGFEPAHYFSRTGQGFSLYLYVQFAFISALVVDFLTHGLAALHYKNRVPSRIVRALMLALPLSSTLAGAMMALWAVLHLTGLHRTDATPMANEFAVVYLVQVPAYVFLAGKNLRYWLRPEPRVWLQGWVTEHQRNLMFCVGVTLYTAAANLTMRFAPQLTAPLFALIDVGFVVWLLTKERRVRRDIVGARLGLAVVSELHRIRRGEGEPTMGAREAAWILRMFDQDGSGTLERAELEALLSAQGIAAREDEVAALFDDVDRDGDGRIDRDELALFLSRGFAADTTRDEETAYCFRRLDRNGDGKITTDELRAAVAAGPEAPRGQLEWLARGVERRAGAAIGLGTFASAVQSRRAGG